MNVIFSFLFEEPEDSGTCAVFDEELVSVDVVEGIEIELEVVITVGVDEVVPEVVELVTLVVVTGVDTEVAVGSIIGGVNCKKFKGVGWDVFGIYCVELVGKGMFGLSVNSMYCRDALFGSAIVMGNSFGNIDFWEFRFKTTGIVKEETAFDDIEETLGCCCCFETSVQLSLSTVEVEVVCFSLIFC